MLLFILLGLFQKRWEINECRQQIQTTAWASGRTWCAAQVVVIDGITAWRVYNKKFYRTHQRHNTSVRLWPLWPSSPCYTTILVILWRVHTTNISGGPTPRLHSYRVQCVSNSSIVRKSRHTSVTHWLLPSLPLRTHTLLINILGKVLCVWTSPGWL